MMANQSKLRLAPDGGLLVLPGVLGGQCVPHCLGSACSLMPCSWGRRLCDPPKPAHVPQGYPQSFCEEIPRIKGEGAQAPCHVCGVVAEQHPSLLPCPQARSGACKVDGVCRGSWAAQGSVGCMWLFSSSMALLGPCGLSDRKSVV